MTQKLCVSCAVAALTLALSSHLTLPLWADGSPSPSAPANLSVYHSPKGSTIYAGGTQATCTVTLDMTNHVVSKVTLAKGSEGYTGVPLCTISGGGGSGATCKAVITPTIGASAYQPPFGATPGWDMATGLGSVNAYNLVFDTTWK
jgi:hypothetical protein